MQPNFPETIGERLRQATTPDDLKAAAFQTRAHYGVGHVVYDWVNSRGERFGAGTYPESWIRHYTAEDYASTDPVIQGCFQRFHPVNWKELDWSGRAAKAFFRAARAHGIGNQGFSVPLRGPRGQFALFTLNDTVPDPEWEAFIRTHLRDVILLAHDFNRAALEFEFGGPRIAAPTLSPRELGALTCLANGFNRAQAAQHMAISEHTLRVYIESARHKLGALNTTHAVARALSRGLIVV